MSLHHTVIFDGNPNRSISLIMGLMADVADEIMSPERAAAERAALDKEARELEAENEQKRQDVIDAQNFWSAMHGVEPPKNGPAEVLKAHAEAADRADRAERARQSREHTAECGCETCNATRLGTPVTPLPKRPGWIVDQEIKASQAEFMAKPATVADVAHLAADVGKVKGVLGQLLRRKV